MKNLIYKIAVKPNELDKALEWVRTGNRLCVPTHTRTTIIDAKCLARWEKAGYKLLTEEGEGYRMKTGKTSVYLLPGQLKYID